MLTLKKELQMSMKDIYLKYDDIKNVFEGDMQLFNLFNGILKVSDQIKCIFEKYFLDASNVQKYIDSHGWSHSIHVFDKCLKFSNFSSENENKNGFIFFQSNWDLLVLVSSYMMASAFHDLSLLDGHDRKHHHKISAEIAQIHLTPMLNKELSSNKLNSKENIDRLTSQVADLTIQMILHHRTQGEKSSDNIGPVEMFRFSDTFCSDHVEEIIDRFLDAEHRLDRLANKEELWHEIHSILLKKYSVRGYNGNVLIKIPADLNLPTFTYPYHKPPVYREIEDYLEKNLQELQCIFNTRLEIVQSIYEAEKQSQKQNFIKHYNLKTLLESSFKNSIPSQT